MVDNIFEKILCNTNNIPQKGYRLSKTGYEVLRKIHRNDVADLIKD